MLQQIEQFPCDFVIDYSEVTGERILPFVIELDQAASNLEPGPGENQRFCYNILGVGSDAPQFADLSHFVLGICEDIPEEQITNISVVIDGVEQEVDFGEGGNVELRTPENPDPPTGCIGLKFDFEEDKVEGEMTFCFELTVPYNIGPNVACLFGGGVTANQLSICGPICGEIPQRCQATAYQRSTVCVPVTITPFANNGETVTFCCGDPTITPVPDCEGVENGSCVFTITQNICVSVPVEFGAYTNVGDPFVQCGQVSSENICIDCGEPNGNNTNGNNSQVSSVNQNNANNVCRKNKLTTPIL